MKLVLGPNIGSKNCRYSRKHGISDADISGIECTGHNVGIHVNHHVEANFTPVKGGLLGPDLVLCTCHIISYDKK